MKNLTLFLLATALLSACKKDSTPPPVDPIPAKQSLIKYIAYSNPSRPPARGDTTFYFYDDQGRCVRREESLNTPSTYSYDGKTITEEMVFSEFAKIRTVYYMRDSFFPDSIITTNYSFNSPKSTATSFFEYDSSGNLLRAVDRSYMSTVPDGIREFTFENGNTVLVTHQSIPQANHSQYTIVRQFDLTRINNIADPCPSVRVIRSKNLSTQGGMEIRN